MQRAITYIAASLTAYAFINTRDTCWTDTHHSSFCLKCQISFYGWLKKRLHSPELLLFCSKVCQWGRKKKKNQSLDHSFMTFRVIQNVCGFKSFILSFFFLLLWFWSVKFTRFTLCEAYCGICQQKIALLDLLQAPSVIYHSRCTTKVKKKEKGKSKTCGSWVSSLLHIEKWRNGGLLHVSWNSEKFTNIF